MIAVLPQEGPLITGEEKIYASGDILGLNCTSGKSHPASTFKWFINGKQVRGRRELGGRKRWKRVFPFVLEGERKLHSLPRSKVIDRLWRGESVQRIDEA